MLRNNRELWWALLAIILITAFYLAVSYTLREIPPSRNLIGHLLGVVGFTLMIMTETLYTLRKRSRSARWGRMSTWLRFHIFTGIVGPYLVLLHTAWNFQGLAGISMLLTVSIVVSGFVGRYIYTAVPRTVDGAEVESGQLEAQIAAVQVELQQHMQVQPEAARELQQLLPATASNSLSGAELVFGRSWLDFRQRLTWQEARRKMSPAVRVQADHLEQLAQRQQVLGRQVASLAAARRMMGLWHSVHIPIGMALFAAAAIHTVAAFYYATLMR